MHNADHVDGEQHWSEEPRSADELWARLQEEIKKHVQRGQYETWFRRAALKAFDEDSVTIAVQNGFARDWLEKYYLHVVEDATVTVFGSARRVTIEVDPELASISLRPSQAETVPPEPRPSPPTYSASLDGFPSPGLLEASDVVLNAQYRFDNFVVGPCNRFAHAAALGVSENPGKTYNPFFLHGSVGLGKTHLMQSLCHSLIDRVATTRILYLSCETFVNHFIGALENGDLQKFRNKYRNVDVLVVDDIHLLANKERTQEEFFHTFNTLYNAGKQIVLSSDSPPKDIPTLQGRLVSRFKWGLVTEVEEPAYETRMAILKRKSRDRGQELPDDVARLLAERIVSNIRELEGAVTKVLGYASLAGMPITTDLARQCLREVFTTRRGAPSMEDIMRVVTDHFGVKLSDLQSRKRTNAIAYPRQVAMYLARQITHLSLEEVGGFFGGRDHSTVLYGVQKIKQLMQDDAQTRDTLAELTLQLQHPKD